MNGSFQRTNLQRIVITATVASYLLGIGPISSAKAAYFEASPEDILSESLPNFPAMAEEANDIQKTRVINKADLGKYSERGIIVDVFRKSLKNPALGKYVASYFDVISPVFKDRDAEKLAKNTAIRFENLASAEFAVVTVDNIPMKAHLISVATDGEVLLPKKDKLSRKKIYDFSDDAQGNPISSLAMELSRKSSPVGNFRLTPELTSKWVRERNQSLPVLNPFHVSSAYEGSSMFWGLWITGGIFMHSTPHYYQLGSPASMGCIRQSYPDAMELFDLVANKADGREAIIRIHEAGSEAAFVRLREIIYDWSYTPKEKDFAKSANPMRLRHMDWLVGELNLNFQRIHRDLPKNYEYLPKQKGFQKTPFEYEGPGHAWFDTTTMTLPTPVFPKCGEFDCFTIWGDPRVILAKARAEAAKRNAQEREESIAQYIEMKMKAEEERVAAERAAAEKAAAELLGELAPAPVEIIQENR